MKELGTMKNSTTHYRIEPATQDWAHPDIEADYRTRQFIWREVSSHFFHAMLGAVPPIYPPGNYADRCFLVGEIFSHNANGEPVYSAFAQVKGHYYATMSTRAGFPDRHAGLMRAAIAKAPRQP